MLNFLNVQPTKQATDAERAFLGLIEGGCQVPIGVNAAELGKELGNKMLDQGGRAILAEIM